MDTTVEKNLENGTGSSSGWGKRTSKTKSLQCKICRRKFPESCDLVEHMQSHSETEALKCSDCSESFKTKNALNKHHKRFHSDVSEKIFESEESPRYIPKNSLQSCTTSHVQSDVQQFQCLECPRSFTQKDHMLYHLKLHIHNGQKPFMCTKCYKLFARRADFMKHLNVHVGEIFKCSQCHKSFLEIDSLRRHQKYHTERPQYWYECVECHKRFKIRANFVEHKKIHTRETPFQCSKCYKFFTEKLDLIKHMTGHTGKKPFQCADCKFFFTHKGILLRHLKIHHVSRPKTVQRSKPNHEDESLDYCDPSALCQVIISSPEPDLQLSDAEVNDECPDNGGRKGSSDEWTCSFSQT